MQYKSESEKVAPTSALYIPVSQAIPSAKDPQIQRTRKILVILLGVCLGLSVVALFAGIFGSSIHVENENAQRGQQIGEALLSIIFYSFGIFAAYRYLSLALRIFAWLGVITVVLTGIAIIFFVCVAIIALIGASHAYKTDNTGVLVGGSVFILFAAGLYVAALILSIIIILFSFKLARLIDANKNVVAQSI